MRTCNYTYLSIHTRELFKSVVVFTLLNSFISYYLYTYYVNAHINRQFRPNAKNSWNDKVFAYRICMSIIYTLRFRMVQSEMWAQFKHQYMRGHETYRTTTTKTQHTRFKSALYINTKSLSAEWWYHHHKYLVYVLCFCRCSAPTVS